MTFCYRNENELQIGSKELFFQLTGAEWIDEMKVFSTALDSIRPSCKEEIELMHLVMPLYNAYRKNPAKLYVHQGSSQASHAIHARENICKGTVVSEYLGEWSQNSTISSSYRWGPINASLYRNYSALIEDGFPNIGAFYLYNIRNIPLRVVFVALEDIAADDIITIHYGMNHSVKTSYHTEYRLKQMVDFFCKYPLPKVVQEIKTQRSKTPKMLGLKKSLALENFTTKLRYIYQTPSALMHLVKEKAVTIDEVFYYYQQIDIRYFLLEFDPKASRRQQEITDYLEIIKEYYCHFQSDFEADLALMKKIRQRIFYTVYVKNRILQYPQSECEAKALLYNEAFDAVQKNEKEKLIFILEQVQDKNCLIQTCLAYAKELQSPLCTWLELLTNPPSDLRPTGS